MGKISEPEVAGILDIVAAIIIAVLGFLFLVFMGFYLSTPSYEVQLRLDFFWFLAYLGFGLAMALATFIIVCAIMALKRKRYVWALTGSICAALVGIGILAVVLIIQSKKEFSQEKQRTVMFSEIYRSGTSDRTLITGYELQDLAEVISCPTCKYADQEARLQGRPWCEAPEPPFIMKNYCYTFGHKE